ncbi:MAG: sulfatase-like hydrolase/transferase [Verrucomicrobiales bacterium]|nr:sulfatase-like hydrolase/transferase [Verrucomicrobiales bacterium]
MRVSAGTNLSARLLGGQPLDFKAILDELEGFPWVTKTKLTPTNEIQTYILTPQIFETTSRIKHILLNPTDAKDATFEIESVRLIFRQEYLAEIPSASGWHGLHEIYHEALVTRTPERIELPLNLPAEPRLDLSIGTIQEGAVRFQIGIRPDGASADQNRWLLQRTVTEPHEWEPVQIDLSRYAGQVVRLTLALEGSSTGLLGFWGSPLIWNLAKTRQDKQQRPNRPQGVIVIWSDTTRPDHLNFYGYNRETTPTLTKLAKEGALFQHCVSQATWTKVATPSLFTSLHPTSHAVHDVPDRLPASADTIAEVFRRNGYATVSFSSLPFTGEGSNMHQGFQEVHEGSSLLDTSQEGKNSREFVGRALLWVERNRELPFFMFLHLFDAHDPFEPRPPYNTLWAKPSDSETYDRMFKRIKPLIENAGRRVFGKGMPNLAEVKKSGEDPDDYIRIEKDWYDGSIRGMDAEIERLRERLQELGLSERPHRLCQRSRRRVLRARRQVPRSHRLQRIESRGPLLQLAGFPAWRPVRYQHGPDHRHHADDSRTVPDRSAQRRPRSKFAAPDFARTRRRSTSRARPMETSPSDHGASPHVRPCQDGVGFCRDGSMEIGA